MKKNQYNYTRNISIIIPGIIQTSLSYDKIAIFSKYKFYFWQHIIIKIWKCMNGLLEYIRIYDRLGLCKPGLPILKECKENGPHRLFSLDFGV